MLPQILRTINYDNRDDDKKEDRREDRKEETIVMTSIAIRALLISLKIGE
jgi:hypothetical protein